MREYILVTTLIVSVFLSSCDSAQSPTIDTATTRTDNSGAFSYPPPIQPTQVMPAYPDKEDTSGATPFSTTTPLPTPTVDPNLGIVTGTLLVNGKPVYDVSLYLAGVIKDDQGRDSVASLDRANSPRAITDSKGNFTFYNVQAGKYGLILDTVLNVYLLHDPKTNIQIMIAIHDMEQSNLGELDYDELPLP